MVMTLNNEMFFFSGQSQLIDFLTQKIHECFLVLGKKCCSSSVMQLLICLI